MADVAKTLADKSEIHEVALRYCWALDNGDMEVLRDCYHEGAVNNYAGFEGSSLDEFVHWIIEGLGRFISTTHVIGNHLIEVNGDTAASETYGFCYDIADPSVSGFSNLMSGFRHVDRFERRNGRWRISERTAIREFLSDADEVRRPALPT